MCIVLISLFQLSVIKLRKHLNVQLTTMVLRVYVNNVNIIFQLSIESNENNRFKSRNKQHCISNHYMYIY